MDRQSTEDFQGCKFMLGLGWIHVTTRLYRCTDCGTRVNPDVKYELWVTVMCQCRCIACSKWTALVGVLVTGEAMCFSGQGFNTWEISVPATQFCCEPKNALKNKVCY